MLILCYALCRMFLQKVDLVVIRYRRWVGPLCHRELIEVRWRNCNALHQFLKLNVNSRNVPDTTSSPVHLNSSIASLR